MEAFGDANALVSGVTTLPAGEVAEVTVQYFGSDVMFSFRIPRAPGEITTQQLLDAVAGTSANTNALPTLDTPFADPGMELLRMKLNELIVNGRWVY